ncbi:hypothetical protein CK203_091407 [Vitis vinifera]|uniref:Uncharacterized protein n=1 Tax=Vitis vinifera TaxID=29760 RepID=A0A438CM03_VITVI|nr:hypothetical protein CK203_091407 [Vitis vinifera]
MVLKTEPDRSVRSSTGHDFGPIRSIRPKIASKRRRFDVSGVKTTSFWRTPSKPSLSSNCSRPQRAVTGSHSRPFHLNGSHSSTSSSNNGSKSIKFLKKTLSFTDTSSMLSTEVVPKGFLVMCVGKELKSSSSGQSIWVTKHLETLRKLKKNRVSAGGCAQDPM